MVLEMRGMRMVLLFCFALPLVVRGAEDTSEPNVSPITLRDTQGRTTVAVAGTDVEVTARTGPSYPVGSTFKSKPKASAEIDVADGTTCLLLEKSEISVVPAPGSLADRIVVMSKGTIQVTSTG